MRTSPSTSARRGFTLIELLMAMTITTGIAMIMVSITSVALDSWNRSRAEVRASRQAKYMVDTMAHDFESFVSRRGNKFEWLLAESNKNLPGSGIQKSANASNLIFFSATTDRYDGAINTKADKGGDVSCVAYQLDFKDPVTGSTSSGFQTYTLYRLLVNPDDTFENLLGRTDLEQAFQSYRNKVTEVENFVCENVYQYTLTFQIEVVREAGTANATKFMVPVSMGPDTSGGRITELKFSGTELTLDSVPNTGGVTADEIKGGRLAAVEISLTVITDQGLRQLQTAKGKGDALNRVMARYAFNYSKTVELPGM